MHTILRPTVGAWRAVVHHPVDTPAVTQVDVVRRWGAEMPADHCPDLGWGVTDRCTLPSTPAASVMRHNGHLRAVHLCSPGLRAARLWARGRPRCGAAAHVLRPQAGHWGGVQLITRHRWPPGPCPYRCGVWRCVVVSECAWCGTVGSHLCTGDIEWTQVSGACDWDA